MNATQANRSNHTRACALLLGTLVLLLPATSATAQDELPLPGEQDLMWLISPLFGYNHDKLKQPDRTGRVQTSSKTAPEYGLFALVAHPRFVVNDFLFFTKAANDTDVMGNFFHANLYGAPESAVTWNLGAGHMYHRIKPQHEDIKISVPLAKAGLLLRADRWGLTFNPYLGYAWERIETLRGHRNNDSYLYGLTVDWRWRMVNVNLKYYYQDSQQLDDNFHNFHARLTTAITRHFGTTVRFDHMEHPTTDDTSVLIGPVFIF